MTCQCYRIGGPFIAEDPECAVHGAAAVSRGRQVEALRAEARDETNIQVLLRIIDDLATLADLAFDI